MFLIILHKGFRYSEANSELCLDDRSFISIVSIMLEYVLNFFGDQNASGVCRYPLDFILFYSKGQACIARTSTAKRH